MIQLVAYVESHRIHELQESTGYFSHDEFPEKVAQLCNEFSFPYRPTFASIAVLKEDDDINQKSQNTSKAYGLPLLLNTERVLPLIQIICNDDIQNAAVNARKAGLMLVNVTGTTDSAKLEQLTNAAASRLNGNYAEARIYAALKWRLHVERPLVSEENDPFSQAGLWPDEDEEAP